MCVTKKGECALCGSTVMVMRTFNKLMLAAHDEMDYDNYCLDCIEEDIVRARKYYRTHEHNNGVR